MEDFLRGLPSFVHDYLNKYPVDAMGTMGLLKELVCFAVLYSNDRDNIILLTEELLQEENKFGVPELINTVENSYLQNILSSTQQDDKKEKEENKELEVVKQSPNIKGNDNHMIMYEGQTNSLTSIWIPWKEDQPRNSKSQISIPEMSSYHEISSDHLAYNNNFDTFWKLQPKNKPRSKSPISINSNDSSTNASQKSSPVALSESSTPLSPISPLSLKPISFNSRTKSPPPSLPPLILRKSMSETTNSFTLQRPRSTFTVQSRINHARNRQGELERKKLLATMPLETSTSKRLKQRVNSGIDWKAIKNKGRIELTSNET